MIVWVWVLYIVVGEIEIIFGIMQNCDFFTRYEKIFEISLDFTTEKKRNFLQLQGLKILINKQINRIINCMQYRPTYLI